MTSILEHYQSIEQKKDRHLRCPKCKNKIYTKRDFRKDNTFSCYCCGAKFSEAKICTNDYNKKGKKRKLSDNQFWKRNRVLKTINNRFTDILDPQIAYRDAALISILFLTGCRISEIIGMKQGKRYIVQPLKRWQISIGMERGMKALIITDIPVLKKKKETTHDLEGNELHGVVFRNVKLPYEAEREFIGFIEKWLRMLPENDDEIVFNICRSRAWQITYRHFGRTFPHFYRHCRAGDIGEYYGFSEKAKQVYFRWSSTAVGNRYSHIGEDELFLLAKKNIEVKENG